MATTNMPSVDDPYAGDWWAGRLSVATAHLLAGWPGADVEARDVLAEYETFTEARITDARSHLRRAAARVQTLVTEPSQS